MWKGLEGLGDCDHLLVGGGGTGAHALLERLEHLQHHLRLHAKGRLGGGACGEGDRGRLRA